MENNNLKLDQDQDQGQENQLKTVDSMENNNL